jgi:flagellar basal-body rod protein FlgF
MLFTDWIQRQTGSSEPASERTVLYTQDRATYRDQQPGGLDNTGNPFDLAIGAATGWFTVRTAQGPRLTRSGHFAVNATGGVVDQAGNALLDTAGQPIQLAPGDVAIHVADDGTISGSNGQIGKIGVVAPSDQNRMTAEGATLFRADVPTAPVAAPQITQGAVEGGNVQAVSEMTRMMNDLREFQFVSEFIQAESDRQQGAIDKILNHTTA